MREMQNKIIMKMLLIVCEFCLNSDTCFYFMTGKYDICFTYLCSETNV